MTLNIVIEVEIDKNETVKDLVNEALGINEDISDDEDEKLDDNEGEDHSGLKYKYVQVKKNAVPIDNSKKLSTFQEGTVFDISK